MGYRILWIVIASAIACALERQWVRLLDEPVFTAVSNPKNPQILYAGGLGHRLYRSFDGGETWDTIVIDFPGGAAQFLQVFVHPRDTAVLLVGGSGFGKLVRSADGGQTWQDVLVPEHAFLLPSGASIIAHPLYPDTLLVTEYIGPGWSPPRLYRSTDGGRTWDTLTPFTEAIPNCALALRWDSLWAIVARCDGAIFASSDWQTWHLISHLRLSGYPQESEIPDLLFVPETPQLGFLAVTFLFDTTIAGRPNGGLYRSTDGGRTWHLFAFPDTSLWAVATYRRGAEFEIAVGGFTLYPDTAGKPLVPGSGIVRTSSDGGYTWLSHDEAITWAPGDVLLRRVWRMHYAPSGTLYVATEAGLYAWRPPLSVSPSAVTVEATALLVPNRQWHLHAPCSGTLSVFSLSGQLLFRQWLPAGAHRLELQRFAAGTYAAELRSTTLCRRWLLLLP